MCISSIFSEETNKAYGLLKHAQLSVIANGLGWPSFMLAVLTIRKHWWLKVWPDYNGNRVPSWNNYPDSEYKTHAVPGDPGGLQEKGRYCSWTGGIITAKWVSLASENIIQVRVIAVHI